MREARVDSSFSLPADLAAEMRSWPEFVRGEGYDVALTSTHEQVTIDFVPADELDEDAAYVRVRGVGDGPLFHRVLGCVVYAMCACSDSVWVTRWTSP